MDANRHVVPAGIASAEYYLDAGCLAARIGEADEALTWLREAVDRGLPASRLRERPELSVLRARPEFHDLVARAKPPPG